MIEQTQDIAQTTQFALQENISGEWFTRPTWYDSADDATLNGEHAFGVDNPAIRTVRVVTIVVPLDVNLPTDVCKCGHMRNGHGGSGDTCCIVEREIEREDDSDPIEHEYADDCMKFERAL